jgi:hypothetical protein
VPRLGGAPGRGDLRGLLRQPGCLRRPGRGGLRVQLRRRGAARAGHRGGLQRGRDDARRLGDLEGGQAARPLPGGERPARRRGQVRVPAGRPRAGPAHAGDRARRHRRGRRPAGQRLVRLLPRVHPGADQGAAAAARPLAVRHRRAPPGVEQGPPGDAGRRVPGLRRGGGPVGPGGGLALRRPHHRLRLRQGLRPPAADEPGQGGGVPARLAAAQGDAVARGAGCHAARAGGVGALGGAAPRAGRGRDRRDPRGGVQLDGRVRAGLPRPGRVRPGPRAGPAAAAGRRPGGAAQARLRVPGARGLARRRRPGQP